MTNRTNKNNVPIKMQDDNNTETIRNDEYDKMKKILKQANIKYKEEQSTSYLDDLSEKRRDLRDMITAITIIFEPDFLNKKGYLTKLGEGGHVDHLTEYHYISDKYFKYTVLYDDSIEDKGNLYINLNPDGFNDRFAYNDSTKLSLVNNKEINYTKIYRQDHMHDRLRKDNNDINNWKYTSLNIHFREIKKIIYRMTSRYQNDNDYQFIEKITELPQYFWQYLEVIELIENEINKIVSENMSEFISIKGINNIISTYLW